MNMQGVGAGSRPEVAVFMKAPRIRKIDCRVKLNPCELSTSVVSVPDAEYLQAHVMPPSRSSPNVSIVCIGTTQTEQTRPERGTGFRVTTFGECSIPIPRGQEWKHTQRGWNRVKRHTQCKRVPKREVLKFRLSLIVCCHVAVTRVTRFARTPLPLPLVETCFSLIRVF